MQHERTVSKEQAQKEFSEYLDRLVSNKPKMPMVKWFAARELNAREVALEYGMTYEEYEEYVELLAGSTQPV